MISRKELYKEWVAALRSGEYPQARNQLQTVKGYCCLGVACEVARKHGIEVVESIFTIDGKIVKMLTGLDLALQPHVCEAFGLGDCGYIPNHGTALTVINDDGTPFSAIADLIEEKLINE